MLSKDEEMEGEVRGKAVNSRSGIKSLARVMKRRNISMEVKKGLRNCILLPTLMYGSEMWMWIRAQHLRVCAVEMSYLKRACGMISFDGESNESM